MVQESDTIISKTPTEIQPTEDGSGGIRSYFKVGACRSRAEGQRIVPVWCRILDFSISKVEMACFGGGQAASTCF